MKLSDLLETSETGRQVDLTSVTLEAEQIRGALLEGAIFDGVTFERLEFLDSDFTASSFFNCTFTSCKFTDCSFHKAEFHDCNGEQNAFARCVLTKTEWYGGDFREAIFTDCDFSWSYLQSIDMRYSQLKNIKLEGALWDGTKVYKTRFESIDFGSLHPARIERTDISEGGDGTTEITVQQLRDLIGA